MSYTKCVYHDCDNTSRNISMFRFPVHDSARTALWIKHSDLKSIHHTKESQQFSPWVPSENRRKKSSYCNRYLISLTNDELSRRYICAGHFRPSCISRGKQRSRLLGPAVPFPYEPSPIEVEAIPNVPSPECLEVKTPTKHYTRYRRPIDLPMDAEESNSPSTSLTISEVPEWADDAELNSDDDDEEVERALYQPPVSVAFKRKTASEDPPTEASGQEDAATAGSSRLHAGYRCDQCRGDIVGSRYCCVECPNYDLCGACEAAGHHATHYVLRVPSDKPHVEVIAVLENIRNVLLQREDAENKCEPEPEVKVEAPDPEPEVKVEAPDPAPGPDPLAGAPHTSGQQEVEVIAVLENIRNALLQKEDAENKCGQELEVKVEAPDPAPGPDPLAGAPDTSDEQEEKCTILDPPAEAVPPPEKRDILEVGDMVVKLELDEGQLMMESFHTVPEPQVYSHSVRAASVTKSNVKVYGGDGSGSGSGRGSGSDSGSGEGYAAYTHSAARPAPVLQGSNVTQEKGNAASSAKRKTTSPPQHAKVKKKLPSN